MDVYNRLVLFPIRLANLEFCVIFVWAFDCLCFLLSLTSFLFNNVGTSSDLKRNCGQNCEHRIQIVINQSYPLILYLLQDPFFIFYFFPEDRTDLVLSFLTHASAWGFSPPLHLIHSHLVIYSLSTVSAASFAHRFKTPGLTSRWCPWCLQLPINTDHSFIFTMSPKLRGHIARTMTDRQPGAWS